ncbi:MAG: pyruvate kinase [candidate division KSB1 bacterium]|nr:pyruvate kinase [candidate division KSB1 bacterium]MDZ7284892.1 pyruvate kinase [candidate division KSB1 bacterium]MDZ7297687.1 pyruvate kinase [candidate division KSB1 bacterium]MDZ7305889.1 pyruvate kinase [candidate division KSB1 bacterium]MDZ7348554.1 pyruvate kinase [candidate division KSB1 bacterium]
MVARGNPVILRRTKIVCTLGPASETAEQIAGLIAAGMNVARLNFSHGTHEEHQQRINLIRVAAATAAQPVAILQDLAGPKVRIGTLREPVTLVEGAIFTLTNRPVDGNEREVSISVADLPEQVQVGDMILLADGALELRVLHADRHDITCRVLTGGQLTSHKGINLPNRSLRVHGLTQKDREDLRFGLQAGVDYVAMSFVRQAADIEELRALMQHFGRVVPIIAKIEKHEALENIDAILAVSDGLMVARGDLAVETALERVPLVQKNLIEKCNQLGKPVITATQMLKSMVENPRPTRAEAADVANAVFDGTDAVMLSEETAVGQYPLETVRVMDRILRAAETRLTVKNWLPVERTRGEVTVPAAISHAVAAIAVDLKVAAILTPTQSGATARMIARYRPMVPIVAITPVLATARQLAQVWGVYPVHIEREYEHTDELIAKCKEIALSHGLVQPGEKVVIAAGLPPGASSKTNLLKVEVVEEAAEAGQFPLADASQRVNRGGEMNKHHTTTGGPRRF